MNPKYSLQKLLNSVIQIVVVLNVTFIVSSCVVNSVTVDPPAYKTLRESQLFVLTQAIMIPADQASVYFQDGNVINAKLLNQRSPHCRLVVNGLSEQAREIRPDNFRLIRIRYDNYFVLDASRMIASLTLSQLGMSHDGGAPIAEEYTTYFYLHSDNQPIVSQLICNHWEDPYDGHHLSLKQIRQALGSLIEIRS